MKHLMMVFLSVGIFYLPQLRSQDDISPLHTCIQIGKYQGSQTFNTGSSSLKYDNKVYSFEGHYFTDGAYYIGQANYFLNGDQNYEVNGKNYKGANSSVIEMIFGGFKAGDNIGMGVGLLNDFAFHGLHVWDQNREQKENVFQWGLGLQVPFVISFGKMFRSVTMVDAKALVTDHEEKYFDGWGYRLQSELQFVPLNFLMIGIRPWYEYRKYSKLQFDEKVSTKTAYLQFFVGISFKGRARAIN